MTDERLLKRLDWFLSILSLWFGLTLVLGAFAVMAFDPAVGLVALATVVLTLAVGVVSFARTTGTDLELAVE